jgi:chemotaxis protein CheD
MASALAETMNEADSSGRALESQARHIHPGEWALDNNRPIATLLGSCVSVCLFDPQLRFGGLNHFMLPVRTRNTDNEYDSLLRGDYAMEVLINAMLSRGAKKQRMMAKAFGGGNVVKSLLKSIGQGNIDFTRAWLEREGIALTASDLGGPWARKIVFDPGNGAAYCRRIASGQALSAQIAQAETDYEDRLMNAAKKPAAGPAIELF